MVGCLQCSRVAKLARSPPRCYGTYDGADPTLRSHVSPDPASSRRIDDVDRRILAELATDARLSYRELARRIGVAPGTVAERIDRLEDSKAITGYRAQIDPSALGYRTRAIIGLQVAQGPPVEDTMGLLAEVTGVQWVAMVTGQWDLIIELLVRDQVHLREVLIQTVWSLPVFRHSETLVVLDRINGVTVQNDANSDGAEGVGVDRG